MDMVYGFNEKKKKKQSVLKSILTEIRYWVGLTRFACTNFALTKLEIEIFLDRMWKNFYKSKYHTARSLDFIKAASQEIKEDTLALFRKFGIEVPSKADLIQEEDKKEWKVLEDEVPSGEETEK